MDFGSGEKVLRAACEGRAVEGDKKSILQIFYPIGHKFCKCDLRKTPVFNRDFEIHDA